MIVMILPLGGWESMDIFRIIEEGSSAGEPEVATAAYSGGDESGDFSDLLDLHNAVRSVRWQSCVVASI